MNSRGIHMPSTSIVVALPPLCAAAVSVALFSELSTSATAAWAFSGGRSTQSTIGGCSSHWTIKRMGAALGEASAACRISST